MVRKYSGSTRPPNVDPDAWQLIYTPKDRERLIKEYEDELKRRKEAKKAGAPRTAAAATKATPNTEVPDEPSRLVIVGLDADYRAFDGDLGLDGVVEYNPAQPIFSGLSKVADRLRGPTDAAFLFCSEADVGRRNGRLFIRKRRELLNNSKDSRATIVVDVPRDASKAIFDSSEMAAILKKHGLVAADYDGCCFGTRSGRPVRTGATPSAVETGPARAVWSPAEGYADNRHK